MRLLLDTHTFLWFVLGSALLSAAARAQIEDPANEKFLSVASIWETAIKVSSGKLTLTQPVEAFFTSQLSGSGIRLLPIELRHASRVASLPFHHRDPFDRLLVAQSLTEQMPLVSVDAVLDAYGIDRRWQHATANAGGTTRTGGLSEARSQPEIRRVLPPKPPPASPPARRS